MKVVKIPKRPVWLEPRWFELVRLINVYGIRERESGGNGGSEESAEAYKEIQSHIAKIEKTIFVDDTCNCLRSYAGHEEGCDLNSR